MTAQLACMTDDLGPEEAMLVELDGANGAPVPVTDIPKKKVPAERDLRGRCEAIEEVGKDLVRKGLACGQPVLGAELVVGLFKDNALSSYGLFEDLQCFGNDLWANAVTGNDCEIDRGCAHSPRILR